MRLTVIRPEFVEFIPRELDDGVLYISERYRTASHKCACGCGERVVTPLSPVEWQLKREGAVVSLRPSIGNWNYACRSHYWIRKNQIQWGRTLTPEEISVVQERDATDKSEYIEQLNKRRDLDEQRLRSGRGTHNGGRNAGSWARVWQRILRFIGASR